jgi:predicted PurR-regulated permease PerM
MSSGLTPTSALRWTTLILCSVVLYVCWPLWPAIALAGWTAALAHPLVVRLERALSGRRRAAGVLVFLVFVLVATPLVVTAAGIVVGVRDLLEVIATSSSAEGALEWIAVGGAGDVRSQHSFRDVTEVLRGFGTEGLGLMTDIAGAAAKGLLVAFVYFAATFTFIVEGRSEWDWVKRHAPLPPVQLERFMAAFQETGRGLLVGVGLTTLAQGLAATIAFVALGVPQGWVLGPLTGIAGVVPVVGSTVIWGPIAVGLLLTGHPVKATILVVVGVAVISTIDNLLRPVFARMGALQIPLLLLFVSIIGGVMMFGPSGAIIGPLAVRLAMEALGMIKSDDGGPTAAPTPAAVAVEPELEGGAQADTP